MKAKYPSYRLDADQVIRTVATLQARISERFPQAGLNQVAAALRHAADQARSQARSASRPIWPLRLFTWSVAIGMPAILLFAFANASWRVDERDALDLLSALESGINDAVFLSLGIFFLVTIENRLKRRRALHALHELRSIAHVIDMHQLTKDPERLHNSTDITPSSPPSTLSPFLLQRYLDYCSELLSLTGKTAAVYLEQIADPAVVSTVNEIEQLSTGLSTKIWQKIAIIHSLHPELPHPVPARRPASPPPASP